MDEDDVKNLISLCFKIVDVCSLTVSKIASQEMTLDFVSKIDNQITFELLEIMNELNNKNAGGVSQIIDCYRVLYQILQTKVCAFLEWDIFDDSQRDNEAVQRDYRIACSNLALFVQTFENNKSLIMDDLNKIIKTSDTELYSFSPSTGFYNELPIIVINGVENNVVRIVLDNHGMSHLADFYEKILRSNFAPILPQE